MSQFSFTFLPTHLYTHCTVLYCTVLYCNTVLYPPVGVELLEDVQIVPDLEADGAAMDGTLVVQRAVVHDVGPHREGDLSEE